MTVYVGPHIQSVSLHRHLCGRSPSIPTPGQTQFDVIPSELTPHAMHEPASSSQLAPAERSAKDSEQEAPCAPSGQYQLPSHSWQCGGGPCPESTASSASTAEQGRASADASGGRAEWVSAGASRSTRPTSLPASSLASRLVATSPPQAE
jgi:hypothetical protein